MFFCRGGGRPSFGRPRENGASVALCTLRAAFHSFRDGTGCSVRAEKIRSFSFVVSGLFE